MTYSKPKSIHFNSESFDTLLNTLTTNDIFV